jgi:CubicO group peptidase (beta-lactamase class C family)
MVKEVRRRYFVEKEARMRCGAAIAGTAFVALTAAAAEWPGAAWERADSAALGLSEARLAEARDYALTGGGSGCIIVRGKLVMAWGDQRERYDLKSTSKSIGVTALGLALKDGTVRLEDPACRHHLSFGVPPQENVRTGWLERITLRMLADQTAGFEKPGGYEPLLFEPGTQWSYSDGGPNWLAECLTHVFRRDLNDVMTERVFAPIGIAAGQIQWRKHAYRPPLIEDIPRREFGSGFSATVDAMARIGYLYLRDGRWGDDQILPPAFMRAVREPDPALASLPVRKPEEYGRASAHYSLLWWNNRDGALPDVPRDAFWSWGLYDSLIVVMPSLDLVTARAGKSWRRVPGADHYDVLRPFLTPLATAGGRTAGPARPPCPPSPVIREVRWAPVDTVVRRARGSDNWPLTWADDDALYGAYGDGKGFEPFVERNLSLGLARIEGGPADFTGTNLRSPDVEAVGDGEAGPKASGLLMVEGVLYLWARNVGNARLAWSPDRGATWTWAPWKFTESFGCPTFLNCGRNYAGARDRYVYVYSPDSEGAYDRADRMVLARVPQDRVADRGGYEFFVRLDPAGAPVWSSAIGDRGAAFADPGRCYRSQVNYDAGLARYLWCQTGAGADTRFQGGLAIYDAPWGPWTTAYFAAAWDIGPGETSGLPAKWMSPDGRTAHLVFSGEDCFSVRQATFVVAERTAPATPADP